MGEKLVEIMENTITRALQKLDGAPAAVRPWLKSKIFGRVVPFVGTAGLRFVKTEPDEWIVATANRRRVQNHLGQVHACVMILLAETAGVMITAMNLPIDRIPLVKKVEADFVKRSAGGMKAVAKLSSEQRAYMLDHEKGEMKIEVTVTDETGEPPVLVTITSAWVPRKRT